MSQYFHRREKLHSAAAKSNHDYRYGTLMLGGNAGEREVKWNLNITWEETFKPKLLKGSQGSKVSQEWRQKTQINHIIDQWKEGERARLFRPSRREWKEMKLPSPLWLFSNGMTAAEPLTLQLSLLFWRPCKEKQQETSTTTEGS